MARFELYLRIFIVSLFVFYKALYLYEEYHLLKLLDQHEEMYNTKSRFLVSRYDAASAQWFEKQTLSQLSYGHSLYKNDHEIASTGLYDKQECIKCSAVWTKEDLPTDKKRLLYFSCEECDSLRILYFAQWDFLRRVNVTDTLLPHIENNTHVLKLHNENLLNYIYIPQMRWNRWYSELYSFIAYIGFAWKIVGYSFWFIQLFVQFISSGFNICRVQKETIIITGGNPLDFPYYTNQIEGTPSNENGTLRRRQNNNSPSALADSIVKSVNYGRVSSGFTPMGSTQL